MCLYTTSQESTARRTQAGHLQRSSAQEVSYPPLSQDLHFLFGWVSKVLELLLLQVIGEHVKVKTSWCFLLLLLSTCVTPWSLHVFHSHTLRQCQPALLGLARATSLSLTGKRLCIVNVCGHVVKVVHSDSEVM